MIDCIQLKNDRFQIMTDEEGVINLLGKKNSIGIGHRYNGPDGHVSFFIFSLNGEQFELLKGKFELTSFRKI